jgi:hypothetical protein
MALQKTFISVHGIEIPNAYIRIDEQSGRVESINIRVRFYVSKELCDQNYPWIEEKLYSFVPDVSEGAPNNIKQGYEYLKTLPEFAGAIDILED